MTSDPRSNGHAVSDDRRTYADDLPPFVWTRLPPDALAEHGRGRFIVSHFADDVSIARPRGGGPHTRAVLSGRVRRS